MYMHSKHEIYINVKVPVRPTRLVSKIVFKTATRCTGKYLGSPFYKGTLLWNMLSAELQKIDSVARFKNGLKNIYTRYQEIW